MFGIYWLCFSSAYSKSIATVCWLFVHVLLSAVGFPSFSLVTDIIGTIFSCGGLQPSQFLYVLRIHSLMVSVSHYLVVSRSRRR